MNETKLFAVAGNPVLHSKSPRMFNAAFKARGIDAVYVRLSATCAEEIADTIRELNIKGANITSPFKEDIIPCLDALDGQAEVIGAVNTVINNGGRLTGYNTDHIGVSRALGTVDNRAGTKRAVIAGAGGAARAALFSCVRDGYDTVIINRTYERARSLAQRFGCRANRQEEIENEVLDGDTLILCLSSSNNNVMKQLSRERLIILDARYGKKVTPYNAGAKDAIFIDGLQWLLFQGAESFRLFTGCEPPLREMSEALYAKDGPSRDKVSFVGFMGAGKSTIGLSVAKLSSMTFVDVDSIVEETTGQAIDGIFKNEGEKIFREYEKTGLEAALRRHRAVISTGGGAVIDEGNIRDLRAHSLVVWLFAGIEKTYSRIGSGGKRPLAARDKDLLELFKERAALYARASHLLVRTDRSTVGEITERIGNESDNAFKG